LRSPRRLGRAGWWFGMGGLLQTHHYSASRGSAYDAYRGGLHVMRDALLLE